MAQGEFKLALTQSREAWEASPDDEQSAGDYRHATVAFLLERGRQATFAGEDESALAGVAKALPSLKRAQKLGKRASRVGFDWPDTKGVKLKIHEELGELEVAVGSRDAANIEEEFGDLLFAVVNLARHLDIDPENALTGANYKFERRFRAMEADIDAEGLEFRKMSLETLDQHWRKAKLRVG